MVCLEPRDSMQSHPLALMASAAAAIGGNGCTPSMPSSVASTRSDDASLPSSPPHSPRIVRAFALQPPSTIATPQQWPHAHPLALPSSSYAVPHGYVRAPVPALHVAAPLPAGWVSSDGSSSAWSTVGGLSFSHPPGSSSVAPQFEFLDPHAQDVFQRAWSVLSTDRSASCHQCKTTKKMKDLVHCTRVAGANKTRRCRKKYCSSCLSRSHGITLSSLSSWEVAHWGCPSCKGTCGCAACVADAQKKGRKEIVSGGRIFGQAHSPSDMHKMKTPSPPSRASSVPPLGDPSMESSRPASVVPSNSTVLATTSNGNSAVSSPFLGADERSRIAARKSQIQAELRALDDQKRRLESLAMAEQLNQTTTAAMSNGTTSTQHPQPPLVLPPPALTTAAPITAKVTAAPATTASTTPLFQLSYTAPTLATPVGAIVRASPEVQQAVISPQPPAVAAEHPLAVTPPVTTSSFHADLYSQHMQQQQAAAAAAAAHQQQMQMQYMYAPQPHIGVPHLYMPQPPVAVPMQPYAPYVAYYPAPSPPMYAPTMHAPVPHHPMSLPVAHSSAFTPTAPTSGATSAFNPFASAAAKSSQPR